MSLRRGDIYPEFPESSGQSPESPGYQGFDPFFSGRRTLNPVMTASGRNWQRPCQRQAMTPGTSYCRLDMTYSCLFDVVDGKSSRRLSAVILLFDDI